MRCDFPVILTATIQFAAMMSLTPQSAVAQRAPADARVVDIEASMLSIETAWEPSSFLFGRPPLSSTPTFNTHVSARFTEERSLKRRLVPYYLVGAVVGGVVGYTAHEVVFFRQQERCDRESGYFCGIYPYAFTIMGAGVGANLGLLAGYLRERR